MKVPLLSPGGEAAPATNARLKALIEIGLELASERDADRLLQSVCVAARGLFGATYVTLGILGPDNRTVQHFLTCGSDAACGVGADWIKAGDPIAGMLKTVVAERRTLRGENPGGDPATLYLPARHPAVQAYLVAPIASPAHVYGWICLVGNEGRHFGTDDEDLVTALSGQVGRIYELEHEIVERTQAESALRYERDCAQRYLDTAEVMLIALDTQWRVTLVNRYACSLLGWTAEELIGRDWIETCVPERSRETVRQRLDARVTGNLSIGENPILTRSGAERLIEWRATLLHDDAGNITGTFSCGSDITERNRAVKALRVAEERMRFSLEAASVGVWEIDSITGVVQWSDTIEAQYGLKPGTFSGTFAAALERIHPDDREFVTKALGKAVASGADFTIQHRALWLDGTVRWLLVAGRFHLDARGVPVRGVGISQDITERRLLEEQYQQAQKMEALGRLAGGVAHDFNNLLTVILGNCELLLDDTDANALRQADIEGIQQAGKSAASLTRQLLTFSRKQIIEPTLLDLNQVVAEMRAMLGRLISEDVEVRLQLWPSGAPVQADRAQLEQIVVNLSLNARDAMPDGGTLTIHIGAEDLDGRDARAHVAVKPGPYVVLTVSDTGFGMTPDVLARLFEPFFTTKQPGKGTGLGLATVRGIVTRSGGDVTVRSEVGVGTSFKVYFPRAEMAEAVVPVAPPVAKLRAGAETVLVVDDDEGIRELARKLLERLGYTVLVAASAAEALRLFEQHPSIDVLLTDVVMPGASGPELTRQLVERRSALKVIYMSGYTEEAIAHHGVLNPGIAFVHKPFTSDTVGRKIREVLDR